MGDELMDGMTLPDWLALHVGRLSVENEYLRVQAQALSAELDAARGVVLDGADAR